MLFLAKKPLEADRFDKSALARGSNPAYSARKFRLQSPTSNQPDTNVSSQTTESKAANLFAFGQARSRYANNSSASTNKRVRAAHPQEHAHLGVIWFDRCSYPVCDIYLGRTDDCRPARERTFSRTGRASRSRPRVRHGCHLSRQLEPDLTAKWPCK